MRALRENERAMFIVLNRSDKKLFILYTKLDVYHGFTREKHTNILYSLYPSMLSKLPKAIRIFQLEPEVPTTNFTDL